MPMFILGMLLNQLQKGEAASRRVFAIMIFEPSDSEDAKDLINNHYSVIRFRNFCISKYICQCLKRCSFSVKSEAQGIMGHRSWKVNNSEIS